MISVAELKQHLRLEHTTTEDTYLADLEVAAVQFVETQTGRYFGPVQSVTEYRVSCGVSLFLREEPQGTVVVSRRHSETAASELVADTEYAIRGRRLVNPNGWGCYEYEITYDAGYTAGSEPEDIRGAVRDLVALSYRARGGFETDIGGGMVRIVEVESIPGLRDTIRSYRRRQFGVA